MQCRDGAVWSHAVRVNSDGNHLDGGVDAMNRSAEVMNVAAYSSRGCGQGAAVKRDSHVEKIQPPRRTCTPLAALIVDKER
jgi:hypothetical protein